MFSVARALECDPPGCGRAHLAGCAPSGCRARHCSYSGGYGQHYTHIVVEIVEIAEKASRRSQVLAGDPLSIRRAHRTSDPLQQTGRASFCSFAFQLAAPCARVSLVVTARVIPAN